MDYLPKLPCTKPVSSLLQLEEQMSIYCFIHCDCMKVHLNVKMLSEPKYPLIEEWINCGSPILRTICSILTRQIFMNHHRNTRHIG